MSDSVCPETGPEGTRRAPEVPVWGAGLAQRSEPERSAGERSGASPAPQTASPNDPPAAPLGASPQANRSGFVAGETEVAKEVDAAWQDVAQGLEAAAA